MKRTLAEAVERLVFEHLAAQQDEVAAALKRAFGSVSQAPVGAARRRGGPRRSEGELTRLADRLDAIVRVHPGETMSVLAHKLGTTSAALHRPMMLLKRTGKLRSAGQRQFTRYFPMHPSKGAAERVSVPEEQTTTERARVPARPRSTP